MGRGGHGHPRLKSRHPTGHPTQHRFFALFLKKLNKILISVPPQIGLSLATPGADAGISRGGGGGVHIRSLTNCIQAKPGM